MKYIFKAWIKDEERYTYSNEEDRTCANELIIWGFNLDGDIEVGYIHFETDEWVVITNEVELEYVNEKMQKIINYLQDGSNYDKENFINDLSMGCIDTMGIPPDELSITSSGRLVGDLHSYNKEFFSEVIKSVINVVESFKN